MLKKLLLILALFIGAYSVQAQKYAYVDTEYILSYIPEYEEAQKELNELSQKWQKEIEEKFAEVEKLKKAYEVEEFLLPDEMKAKRKAEIERKYNAAMELQRQRFGVKGDLFIKRQELLKPIQDKIFNAIQEVAKQGNYAFVFDKAGNANILYANPNMNKSDRVLKAMGIKVKK